ncbi:hypothetical protein GGI11_003158 [Coemansia sp. RSA 2049]|nr:hypothetical protein H4217_008303 [Coemansia sp. RSA 1939]KAJ2517416.1 hypothetical protein GGI11_003158 [Coemansia sp. RSA 2049]KAJ2593842.1 hypothetical protein EV177_008486 [Coemansia sp. RSA 1804]KAJ2681536.1 hypothetical protein GGH99_005155 [Coemansia sp. RSA 1285]
MSGKSIPSLEELIDIAAKYDRNNYYKGVPLALHPLWQLVPIVGNIVVFAQTCTFIRQVNVHVRVPYRERIETWISIGIMLIIGMVPILGLVLTIYCTNCSDYLAIAVHYLSSGRNSGSQNASTASLTEGNSSQKKEKVTNPGELERGIYEGTVATVSNGSLVIVSHANPKASSTDKLQPASEGDAEDKIPTSAKKSSIKRNGSVFSQKSQANDVKNADAAQRTPSVFERYSKLSWMEDVMALSPTDNNRASFSNLVSARGTAPQPNYTNIHDLATRNSRMDITLPPSSSLQNLPSYFGNKNGNASSNDLKAMLNTRRMTHSLHISNDVLDEYEAKDGGNKLLKRPDYSRFKSRDGIADKRSSSLVGLAPSPQPPATAE